MQPTELDETGLKPTDLAYYAGFLDGEGCFLLSDGVRIMVINCYPVVLVQLMRAFGGTVRLRRRLAGKHRAQWRWCICGPSAIRAIKLMLPYLREKRRQAELLLLIPRYPLGSMQRLRLADELKHAKRINYE